MRKTLNLFLLLTILGTAGYGPVAKTVEIYNYKASAVETEALDAEVEEQDTIDVETQSQGTSNAKSVYVEDIHNLDWTLLNVGDTLNIDVQDLNNFNDYIWMQDEWKDIAVYSPENNSYTLVSDERDIQPSIQPKYVVDTDEEIYFGTTYNASSTRGFFGLYGYIQMITRPSYNYTHSESSWSNAGSGENSWYASVDPDYTKGVKLKYKEEGRFKTTKYAEFNYDWNTQTVHIDPKNAYGEFLLCTLPEGNTTYNCNHKDATNVTSIGYQIDTKYLDNKFISLRYNAGTYKENSALEILGLNTHAYIESFGEITTSNKQVYVGAGTTLEEAHNKADPRYNEFIENQVTAVGREIEFSDLVDDGGYDPDTVGVYTFAYNVEKGFDGGFVDTEYVDIHVIDPDQETSLEAYDVTYPKTYAPASNDEIIERMKVSAYDPNFEEDVTDQVKISNLGGYNPTNPQVGQYTITFYINASNGATVYKTAVLRIISPALSEEVTVTQEIVDDEDEDLQVSPGELVTFEVTMVNTTGVDLDKPRITYTVDPNYLVADTFKLLSGRAKLGTISDSQIDVQYDHIFKDEAVTFKYQIEASTDWYIHTAEQSLTNLINTFSIEAYGYEYEALLPAGLVEGTFTSFDSSFEAVDDNHDGIITPGEEITTTDVFINDSYYSLFDISVYIGDGDKIDSTPIDTIITSNMREIKAEDYLVDSNDVVYIYDVMPSEEITIKQKFNANDTFNTVDNVELSSTHKVYGQSTDEVAHEQVLTEYFEVNKADIYNVNVETSITDYVNGAISPNEEFEVKFIIENNGYVNLNDLVLNFDLSDANIETSELTTDIVELTLMDENGNDVVGKSVIGGNQIHYEQIKPNQKLVGYITLVAAPEFDTDAFVKGLNDARLYVPLIFTDSFDDIYEKELSMPLDTKSAASVKTTARVVELVGDGDGKVDPYESFEYIFDLQNIGKIDLNMLTIALAINANNGVTVDSYDLEVYDDGEVFNDYTIVDDLLTINHFDPGHELIVNIIVNYSFPLYEDITTNLFTINHEYLDEDIRQFNVAVDVQNNQSIELEATASETNVAPGQTVNVDLVSTNTGSTVEYNSLISFASVDKNATLKNISNVVVNDGKYKVGSDYEITDKGILIYEQKAGEKLTINFDLAISRPLYIDPNVENYTFNVNFNQVLTNKKSASDSIEFTPIVSDTAITTDLKVATATGDKLVKTSDGLVYTYTIQNGSDINLTNTVVQFDKSDIDIDKINSFVVTSTDETFEYSSNNVSGLVKFSNLGAGESVTIVANVSTNNTFDSSATVDASFNITSDFIEHSDAVSIEKDFDFTTSVETSSTLLSTSSGNLLVGADEVVTYQVRIDNVGNADISNLVIDTNVESQGNFISQSIASLTIDQLEVAETEGYSYDVENATLIIDELKVGEVATIIFDIQTSNSIEYVEQIPVINTITSDHVEKIEQINLYIDTSHIGNLEIDYYLEETNSDEDGKVDPGEINYIDMTLTNTDFIALDDVYIYDTMNDPNLTDYFLEAEAYDGEGNPLEEGVDYIHYGDYIHIPSIPGNSSIRGRVKLEANETFTAADNAYITNTVRATFPTVGTVDTPFEVTIPLDKPNNLDYDLNLDIENANGNEFISPGDTINVSVDMTNTGKVDIKDAHIVFAIDDNVDVTTIKLDFLSSLNASIDGMHLIINELPVGETITVTGSVKTKDTFNKNALIQFDADVNHQTVAKHAMDSIRIDTSSSALEVDYDLVETNGDGDNLIDPDETYDLIFTLENTGNIELSYTELINTDLSENIKSMTYDGTLSLVDGNDIIVKSIKAGDKQTIKFHIQFASVFNEEQTANIYYNVSQMNIEDIPVELALVIDTDNLTGIETNLTVSDASGNDLASNNEELTYTYTVRNTGSRNISNLVIKSDLADSNLTDTPYDQVITINGVDQALNYSDITKNYLVPELKVGEELILEYKVSTQDVLTYPIVGKLFVKTIPNIVRITTLDSTVNESNLVRIAMDPEILELVASATIEDEDKNGYLAANENLVYELKLENTGATRLNFVSTRKSQTGTNVVVTNNITVLDESGIPLILGTDYTVTDKVVTIAHLDAGETVTIRYEMEAGSQLYMNGSTNIRSIISNEYITSQTLNTSILPDTADRMINYTFNSVLSNELTFDDFGVATPSTLVISNNGNTIENDFKISVDNISSQMTVDPDSVTIYKNGKVYDSANFDLKTGTITISEMLPGETIVISANTLFNDTIVSEGEEESISFDYDVRVDFSDGSHQLLETSNSIVKELISNVSAITILADPITDLNLYADSSEVLTGSIIVHNNGYLQQNDLEVVIEPNEVNANEDTFEIVSVTDLLGNELSTSTYTIDDNKVVLSNVPNKQYVTIKYQYRLNDYLDLGQNLELIDLLLKDTVNLTTNNGQNIIKNPTISVNPLASSVIADGTVNDEDGNGKVHPTERVETEFTFTNDGSIVQHNLPLNVESYSSNIEVEDFTSLDVILTDADGNDRVLVNGKDYSLDLTQYALVLNSLYPGESVSLDYHYITPEIIQNTELLTASMSATPELRNKARKSLAIAIDYDSLEHVTTTSSLTRDDSVVSGEQEQINYTIDLVNDGQVEYMQLFTNVYLSESNYDGLDSLEVSVTKNGEVYEPYNIELYDSFIAFELHDILVGDEYSIEITYTIDGSKQAAKSKISTMLYATGYAEVLDDAVRLAVDTITPEIEKQDPYINGLDTVTIDEETMINDAVLSTLFEIETNEGAGRELSIDYDIDTNVPGEYVVTYTLEDTLTDAETAVFKPTLIVEDKLPVITGKKKVVIDRTETIEDLTEEFAISATEINKDDLTYAVTETSAIEYGVIGTYPVMFTVVDNEGNEAKFEAYVEIVNSLYPVLTGNDIVISVADANELTSDKQILNAVNAFGRNYDGADLTSSISIDDDGGFLTAGAYVNGDSFVIDYSLTNDDGRSVNESSTITISDEQNNLTFSSISPIVVKTSDKADLNDITAAAKPTAHIQTATSSEDIELSSSDVVETNYTLNQEGLFIVKYYYQTTDLSTNLAGTHSVLVFVSNDGTMPDNDKITINDNVTAKIMPGDKIEYTINITNDSFRTKVISSIDLEVDSDNIKSLQSVSINGSKLTRSSSLMDIEIGSGETTTITTVMTTNERFTYEETIESTITYKYDGATKVSNHTTKVDKNSIKLNSATSYDRDVYYEGESGTVTFDLMNDGTMDSTNLLVDIVTEFTNVELTTVYIDEKLVSNASNLTIKAGQTVHVTVNFIVKDTVVFGTDKITLFDDADHKISTIIPVDYTVVTSKEDESNQKADQSTQGDENDNPKEESNQSKQYTKMQLAKTGAISIVALLVALLIVLLGLKKKNI